MSRIATPIEDIRDHYQIIVIGSGYGGSIAASRLARAGQQVCLLERGKEIPPGEYPNTDKEVVRETQYDTPDGHLGPVTGLYDYHFNADINMLVGCGLGGTSLINANVFLPPDERVFDDERWPRQIRSDAEHILNEYGEKARIMLGARPYPESFPRLRKLEALEKSAAEMGEPSYRVPIHVSFETGPNHVGVHQEACKLCGDCISGCNYGSKNTLLMNYLPDARNHGAEIFTQVQVRSVQREDDRWVVYFNPVGYGRNRFRAPEMFVSADIVILGAGSLGSTEILLRSRCEGLPLSRQLGQHFTGNGDFIGFSYNGNSRINSIGYGKKSPEGREPVGPCITGIMDMRGSEKLDEGLIIEDGTTPGAYANRLLPLSFALASIPLGKDTDRGILDFLKEQWRQLISLLFGPYFGADQRTQLFLSASYDDARGRMYLKDDRLRVTWPDVGEQPNFKALDKKMYKYAKTLGGIHIRNPLWNKLFGYDVITAHPLGGCAMGEDAERGVVNHKSQVFASTEGEAVHEGLYVMDGAVMPRSLGINPLMTISALAERSTRLLAEDHGWQINYALPSAPKEPPKEPPVTVSYTERMVGHFTTKIRDDLPPFIDMQRFFDAEKLGKEEGNHFDYVLTGFTIPLDDFYTDPLHPSKTIGAVIAPTLSRYPLTVTDSELDLFVAIPGRKDAQHMLYSMKLTTAEGKRYLFSSFKILHRGWGNGAWGDTAIMYFTLREGHEAEGPIYATGVTRMKWSDFMIQIGTTQPTNIRSRWKRFTTRLRFGLWFMWSFTKFYRWRIIFPGVIKKKWKPSYGEPRP